MVAWTPYQMAPSEHLFIQICPSGLLDGKPLRKSNSLYGYLPSDLLDGRPLGKSNSLYGYFPSDLLDGRPLGKSSSLSGYFPRGLLDGRPLGKSSSLSKCFPNGLLDGIGNLALRAQTTIFVVPESPWRSNYYIRSA